MSQSAICVYLLCLSHRHGN